MAGRRLARHHHAGGVRRRRRRRPGGRDADGGGRRQRRLPQRRHHRAGRPVRAGADRQVRHPGAEASASCRRRPPASCRCPSVSPSRTPAPTPRASRRSPRRWTVATRSTAARSSSPAPSRPSGCCSSPGPRRRTTARSPRDGMTLFLAPMDRDHIECSRSRSSAATSCRRTSLFIDDLFVPDEDRIGEEGKGFKYLLAGLNAERIIVASVMPGHRPGALRRAVEYAKQRHRLRPSDRDEPGRPVPAGRLAGQARRGRAAHPPGRLALRQRRCRAPRRPTRRSTSPPSGPSRRRTAPCRCTAATATRSEYHVERYWREVRVERIAPIANELVLAYLGEKVLGLPRSY